MASFLCVIVYFAMFCGYESVRRKDYARSGYAPDDPAH